MSSWLRASPPLAVILFVAAWLAWRHVAAWLDSPLSLPQDGLELEVSRGDTLTSVTHQLAQQGVLGRPGLLVYLARYTGQSDIRAGYYRISPSTTHAELLDKLHRGDVTPLTVTFVEGWSWRRAWASLRSAPRLALTLPVTATDAEVAAALGITDYGSPEGWLFPDTYFYHAGDTDLSVLRTAYSTMQDELARAWAGRTPNLPYQDSYQALVMASIVEKETAVDREREAIAGVFVGRLRLGMRLQTDPTVIYALGESFDGDLRRRDLQVDSPFNTYRYAGLPPTPIALPGRRSIEAALHPREDGMLYFVARGDGTHQFSASLDMHRRAVQQFQVSARARDYRSTPRGKPDSGEP